MFGQFQESELFVLYLKFDVGEVFRFRDILDKQKDYLKSILILPGKNVVVVKT